jgi:transcriptional regulator with GAF, ATPase, and Fis domain
MSPTSYAQIEQGVEAFVRDLVEKQLGSRFGETHIIVSIAAGTPQQWACLLDVLDKRGASLSVVYDAPDETLSVWRCALRERNVERQLSLLEQAPALWNVLLTGPTGAGKTETAQRLHNAWARNLKRRGRFVAINAGALPRELLRSELFGHVKGAFTGADATRPGALLNAQHGTLFLDEIGDLPLDLQVQLLTAIEVRGEARHRVFVPLGADRPEEVDTRMIFGTNRDLHAMAHDKRFRLDLLGRISTHHVELPPLADARHRIASAYVRHFEALSSHYANTKRFSFDRAARRTLFSFVFSRESTWPWNHRDVAQSADRIAMRAWSEHANPKDRSEVMIKEAHVRHEIETLRARWASLARDNGAITDDGGWSIVRENLRDGAWETLSWHERWELRYLLEARKATRNNAEAWRKIGAENLLEGAASEASQRNPSNAFDKRWRRYVDKIMISKR